MRVVIVVIETVEPPAHHCELQFMFHSESESIAYLDRYDVINVNTLAIGFGGTGATMALT